MQSHLLILCLTNGVPKSADLQLNPLDLRVKPWVIQSFLTLDYVDRTLSETIRWKAVEQYFTVVLFVNPLTPRVKPWVIQSSLTLDSVDRTLSETICWKAVEQYFTVVLFVIFGQFRNFELGTVRGKRINVPQSLKCPQQIHSYS